MDLQARVTSYPILSRRDKAAKMRASDRGVASSSRIWPKQQRSEDRVNDPRLPVRSGPWYCRGLGGARRYCSWPYRPESSSNSRATSAWALRITSAHHQTVSSRRLWQHRPATSVSWPVNSGTRWLPVVWCLRLKRGAGVPPWGPQLATSRNPSVGAQMVGEHCRRVESAVK